MADETKEKLNIRLHVYDTDMNVKVDKDDEEMYRQISTLITNVVGKYNGKYKGLKSEKEILYMAMVDISLRYKRESKRNDFLPYSEMLEKLSKDIDNALNS